MKRYLLLPAIAFFIAMIASCDSGPGQGGQATITGKVYAKGNWNSTCTIYRDSADGWVPYYVPDVEVYIIYGDEPTYGERVRTGPDGTFQFKYLRRGSYTVYTYSNDCTSLSGIETIYAKVEISDKKQEVNLTNLRINK